MRNALVISSCVLLFSHNALGQDYRYAQFYNAPLLLNPALTGDHKYHYRFNLNYKDQWTSIANSFRTASGSFDMPAFENVDGDSKLGFGLSYLSDKAGSTNYGFRTMNLSTAYHLQTSLYSRLSAGLVFGYGQSGADFSNVKWESQHNGNNYDPGSGTGDVVLNQTINYFDAGAGIAWTGIDMVNDRKFTVGLSGLHLKYPNHSFIRQYDNRLKPKIQMHAEADFGHETYTIKPKLLIMNQGPSTYFSAGMMVRFGLGNIPDSRFTDAHVSSAFEVGLLYHYNHAISFAAQYEFRRDLMIALSYDISVSEISRVSPSGGFEIALRYQGLFKSERIKVKKDRD